MDSLQQIYTREWLIQDWAAERKREILLFWGHTPKDSNGIGRECLSQWYPRPFNVDGTVYPTAEHWMMVQKAKLFKDEEAISEILSTTSPKSAKASGRGIKNFNPVVWDQHKFSIVVSGNLHKFQQHPDLSAFLIGTEQSILIEASPSDRIWGIGLSANDPSSTDPSQWKGENLLGFALMQVREALSLSDYSGKTGYSA